VAWKDTTGGSALRSASAVVLGARRRRGVDAVQIARLPERKRGCDRLFQPDLKPVHRGDQTRWRPAQPMEGGEVRQ
jgi:hypothetical protein